MQVYLDNSATTRPCDAAVEAMRASMRDEYFNPSALYKRAVDAERALTAARAIVAEPLGMREQQVLWTSGGTESDNLAILGFALTLRGKGDLLYSAAEHPAVKNACREAASLYGYQAREIPLDKEGITDLDALGGMLGSDTRLVCVMQVCNETGVIQPLEAVVNLRDRLAPNAAIHVDGVQGYLRVPLCMRTLNIQSYAVSAHKVHGPKGVGALIVRDGHRLHPLTVGGGQQRGLRSGTENTAGIAGFAAAVGDYPPSEDAGRILRQCKVALLEILRRGIPALRVLGVSPFESNASPHILYVAVSPVRAETLVHALASDGVMVGTGSACASRHHQRSEVLSAMRISPDTIDCSIRLSFSITNTVEEVCYAAERIVMHYHELARFTRR